MALEVCKGDEADHFVVCLFKRNENVEWEKAHQFVNNVEATIRGSGGNIQIRAEKPKEWEIFDGKDNFSEPNHLNPAIFDFNCVMVGGFRNPHDVGAWWNSDPVFELLKYRSSVEKLGVYRVEGLQRSYDVSDHSKVAFGERLVMMEFINMQSFKPVQQYVDNYRLFAERSLLEIGIDCNLLFSEGVTGVLMNEFPLDACIASFWRMKSDAQVFYDSETYQRQLFVLRRDFSRSFAMLCPMFDERAAMDAAFAKKRQLALEEKKQQQASRRPNRG